MEPCPYSNDIIEIKRDVKELLKFKWQMSGGWVWLSIAACVVLSLVTATTAIAMYIKS